VRLQSVQLARTTWLMEVAETNPHGRNIFVDFIPALVNEYQFKTSPQEGGDFKEGMKFTLGTFTKSKGDIIQVGLTIWSDGVAADTYSSTDDSEEFLQDIARLLAELGYRYEPTMVRRKVFISQIFVQCTKRLKTLNPQLEAFAKKISSSAFDIPFEAAAIEFWPDQTRTFKPANFSFQKRTGDAADEDRYWSQAPLSTSKHLELLQELEAILS